MIRQSWLEERLNTLLEDSLAAEAPAVAPTEDPASKVLSLHKQLEEARLTVTTKEREYKHAVDGLNAHLAMAVKKVKPSLNISMESSGCKIGYKSKFVTFTPNPTTGVWDVTAPAKLSSFVNGLKRYGAEVLSLTTDLQTTATAVGTWFSSHYKTLGEELQGIGTILIEGREVSALELAGKLRRQEFDPREVAEGMRVEMGFVSDPVRAADIVKRRLAANPRYYSLGALNHA